MRWKQLRKTFLDDMWQEREWDEKSWDEVRRAHMIWDERKCGVWSASVKCEECSVKNAVWSVRKVFAWRCIAPGSCAGHVLGQHLCNSFAQSTHARASLARGACKFYRWKRSYNISLRQLPPRLVRILLVRVSFFESSNRIRSYSSHVMGRGGVPRRTVSRQMKSQAIRFPWLKEPAWTI